MPRSKNRFSSHAAALAVLFLACTTATLGCTHSYGATGAGVTPFGQGRTAGAAGLSIRSDWRLPRTYLWYLMTEATMASQVVTIDPPPLPSQAGHLRPVEKIGFGIGQMRVPETNHAVGLRGGPRVDLWHGSLGDTQSAWMGSVGLELGTVFALSRLNPPWQSDSTVTTDWVLMPSVMAGGALRFGHPEQSRFAAVYSLSLSVGLQFSSSFVP